MHVCSLSLSLSLCVFTKFYKSAYKMSLAAISPTSNSPISWGVSLHNSVIFLLTKRPTFWDCSAKRAISTRTEYRHSSWAGCRSKLGPEVRQPLHCPRGLCPFCQARPLERPRSCTGGKVVWLVYLYHWRSWLISKSVDFYSNGRWCCILSYTWFIPDSYRPNNTILSPTTKEYHAKRVCPWKAFLA